MSSIKPYSDDENLGVGSTDVMVAASSISLIYTGISVRSQGRKGAYANHAEERLPGQRH